MDPQRHLTDNKTLFFFMGEGAKHGSSPVSERYPEGNKIEASKLFNLDMPETHVTLRQGRILTPFPSFSGGLAAFRENETVNDPSFDGLWLETERAFDHVASIDPKRPNSDQITLPFAMKRFGFDRHNSTPNCNLSTANRAFQICEQLAGADTLTETFETQSV